VAEVVVVVVGKGVVLVGSCVVVVVVEATGDVPGGGVVFELDVGGELVPPDPLPA